MEVFISWSGKKSGAVASALRAWLPCIFQTVSPWMSKTDIPIGYRWYAQLGEALERTDFGILCLSQDNFKTAIFFHCGGLEMRPHPQ